MNKITLFLSSILKDCTEQEIKDFFKETFHHPLDVQFMGNDEIPAEVIRQKRKQIQTVENFFLSLKKKK